MTESEWLDCGSPMSMLDFLSGKMSTRKMRLFACACCRQYWRLFGDERCRYGVEMAERFEDGKITVEELWSAQEEARIAGKQGDGLAPACCCFYRQETPYRLSAVKEVIEEMLTLADYELFDGEMSEDELQSQNAILADILRDIFGNPHREHEHEPAWLTSEISALSQQVYDDQAFDHFPRLLTMLTNANCDNHDLLDHIRSDDHHVRGCWAIDLLIGKD